jgi:prepilin-type N-terminal cleavage/methylation domain-containing protein
MRSVAMSKRGFTLIELLAVIVILGIILAIAIPSITGIIDRTTKDAFLGDTRMLLKAIDYKKMENENYDPTTLTIQKISDDLALANNNYSEIEIIVGQGKTYIVLEGLNKWEGLIACGLYTNLVIVSNEAECPIPADRSGANEPKTIDSMIPVRHNGSVWVKADINNIRGTNVWYNYNVKQWANVVLVHADHLDTYLNAPLGTTINSNHILAFWVWVPRYAYRITSGWHSNTTGTIGASFSRGIDDTKGGFIAIVNTGSSNDSNGTWTNHPAFTFGDSELTGLWVGKFTASALEGVATETQSCFAADNVTTKKVVILPNVRTWRCINVNNAFIVSKNMETDPIYGWGTSGNGIDVHLIKNVEWGAAAYLSKSSYGKENEEVWINNNYLHVTGCAGNSASASSFAGCQNEYHTTNGVRASTTGNIYGIYDMAGSGLERTAAYVANGHGNLNTHGSSVINADAKYKDVYQVGATDNQINNYALAINKKGDAVYETSSMHWSSNSWYTDRSSIVYSTWAWFGRGGWNDNGVNAGVFAFDENPGSAHNLYSFRPVLIVR